MEIDVSAVDRWERYQYNFDYQLIRNIDICDFTLLRVVSRIGSNSVEGEVFKIFIQDKYFAMKIMPLINFASIAKNENEIRIASMVSGKYFLRVYAHKRCENVYFNFHTSNFYDSSMMFAYAKHISELIPKERVKRFIANFKLGKFQTVQDFQSYLNSIGYENWDLSVVSASADLMISELVWGDLATYLTLFQIDLKDIITQVKEALYELHYKFHVKHNDIHLGNILVRDLDSFQLLIHDFGKSEIYTDFENTKYYFEQDFKFFVDKLEEFVDKL